MIAPPIVQVYRLPVAARMFVGFFAVVFPVIGVAVGVFVLSRVGAVGLLFAVVWLWVVGFNLWLFRPWVTSIELHPDGRVVFNGLLGRREVPAVDITAVHPMLFDVFRQYGPVVELRSGRVRLFARLERFHDLLVRLQQLNPAIRIDV